MKTLSFGALFFLTLSCVAFAGGSPTRLESLRETSLSKLPEPTDVFRNDYGYEYRSWKIMSETQSMVRLLTSRFEDFKDPGCVQKMFTTPGHLARVAAGYRINYLVMTVVFDDESRPTHNVTFHLEYMDSRGTQGEEGNGVSSRLNTPVYECELK